MCACAWLVEETCCWVEFGSTDATDGRRRRDEGQRANGEAAVKGELITI